VSSLLSYICEHDDTGSADNQSITRAANSLQSCLAPAGAPPLMLLLAAAAAAVTVPLLL
jgi:hypothetical protein